MKSPADSSTPPSLGSAPAPFWTIAQVDLRGLFKSKITYVWVLAAVFIQVLRTLASASSGTTSSVVSSGLSDFVYIWSLVIIGLAASSVSSEAGELADSILSKSVTRLDYVFAKFASRITVHADQLLLVTAVLVGLSLRLDAHDYGAGPGIRDTRRPLMLVMLTTLGVALSIALPNTVTAIVTLLVVWYSMTFFFPVIGLGLFLRGAAEQAPPHHPGHMGLGRLEAVAGFVTISGVSTALSSAYFYMKDI